MSGFVELSGLIAEASKALSRLDAERLEEIALACEAFAGEAGDGDGTRRELQVLERVIAATRANLAILQGVCRRNVARLDYGLPSVPLKVG